MTVTSLPVRDEFTGSAGQTVFNYTFLIFTANDLNVYITPSGQEANDSTDITTAYTVDTGTIGNPVGGFITLNSGVNSGDLVTIVSNIVEDRTTDYQNSGDFLPDTVNDDFDRVVSIAKQTSDSASRTLVFQESLQNATGLSLPNPVALNFIRWKSDLSGMENVADGVVIIPGEAIGTKVDMVANTELQVGNIATTTGYTTAGDGGDNMYEIVAAGTGTDDGGEFIDLPNTTPPTQAQGLFPKGLRSIKQWGAFCDDTTDDTTAVIAAVNAMTSNTSLRFPGQPVCNATMDFTGLNDISLIGEGWGTSIIKRTNGTFGDTVLFSAVDPTTTQTRGITITDLQFYCAADMTNGAVIHAKNCTRVITDHTFIRNCHVGIHLEGIRDSRFDNIEIISNEFWVSGTRPDSCHVLIDVPADSSKVSTETFFSNFNFTTAGNNVTEDLDHSILFRGDLDGIWFSDGHTFGGNTSNIMIDGNNQDSIQSIIFRDVWIDQFTNRNLIIQGTTTTNFRFITFNDCRLLGGLTDCIATDLASNIADVTFKGGIIGITLGLGVSIASGQFSFNNVDFKRINQGLAATGTAISFNGSSPAGTTLTVKNCTFECSNLTYAILCSNISREFHFHDNLFTGQDGNMDDEIRFTGAALNGTCSGNATGRTDVGEVAAQATVSLSNLATDSYTLTGGVPATVANFFPTWHGRRITVQADGSNQDIASTGNIRNRDGVASSTIEDADLRMYEFRLNTFRWTEV